MKLRKMMLNINGVDRMFMCDPENDKLSDVLRRIGLTGVKVGCGTGVCGSCSIILNGQVIRSCTKKISQVEEYSKITTIEGIGTPQHLHPLQVAWMNCGAVQCGFCVPGFIVSAYALLEQNPDPTREEVRDWFQKTRNVCRCTGYKQIVDAVENSLKQALPLFLSGLTAGMAQREPQIRASFPTPENSQPDNDVDWDFLGE